MNNIANKLILYIDQYENIDKELYKNYIKLLSVTIKTFFSTRKYLIKQGDELIEKEYELDEFGLLKLLSVQDEMLKNGVNLFYSLSTIDENEEYETAYDDFCDSTNIRKINLNRNISIEKLLQINDNLRTHIISYMTDDAPLC